jgi:hypothetical protein
MTPKRRMFWQLKIMTVSVGIEGEKAEKPILIPLSTPIWPN